MKRKYLSIVMILAMMAFIAASCSTLGFGVKDEEEQAVTSDDNAPVLSADNPEREEEEIIGEDLDLENDPDLQERDTSGILYDQELDGAQIVKVKTPSDKFVGKWTANSDKAAFLYDNIDLVVNSNGSWAANITDEKLGGSWKEAEDYIHLDDTSELDFDFDLAFDNTGALLLIEHSQDGDLYTVLVKAN